MNVKNVFSIEPLYTTSDFASAIGSSRNLPIGWRSRKNGPSHIVLGRNTVRYTKRAILDFCDAVGIKFVDMELGERIKRDAEVIECEYGDVIRDDNVTRHLGVSWAVFRVLAQRFALNGIKTEDPGGVFYRVEDISRLCDNMTVECSGTLSKWSEKMVFRFSGVVRQEKKKIELATDTEEEGQETIPQPMAKNSASVEIAPIPPDQYATETAPETASEPQHDPSHSGKINQYGILFVGRPGRLSPTQCIYDDDRSCSHSCVAFREPRVFKAGKSVSIDLCKPVGTVFFEDFTDERPQISIPKTGG